MKIAILGTGMFGFALARYLGTKYKKDDKISIVAYDRDQNLIKHLQQHRRHLYHFKRKKLPKNIIFTTDKKYAVRDADIVILAITSQAIREVIREIRNDLKSGVIIVNTAKSLEINTAKTFFEVIKEELENTSIKYKIAKLSGGTFAEDLVNNAPLGADIGSEDPYVVKKLQNLFHSRTLRIYGNTDIIGVEYAGAFKNVIAILAGIVYGLGLPYGSETHLISRAAKEAKEIALALGAKPHTFSMESQCWGNDLWMSCTGRSRNREYGILIGRGLTPTEALIKLEEKHKTVEGYYTVKVIPELIKKTKINGFILNQIYSIIYKNKKPKQAIKDIMKKEPEDIEDINF